MSLSSSSKVQYPIPLTSAQSGTSQTGCKVLFRRLDSHQLDSIVARHTHICFGFHLHRFLGRCKEKDRPLNPR